MMKLLKSDSEKFEINLILGFESIFFLPHT